MNEFMIETRSSFVKPHFIPELGCEGLSAEEIAQSLGTPSKEVRRKLKNGGLNNILELLGEDVSQGRPEVSTLHRVTTEVHEINNLTFEGYYLATMAAKMFVALYQNDTGRAYLAFLIRLDVAVEKYMEIDRKYQLAQRQVLQLQEGMRELSNRFDTLSKRLDDLLAEPALEHDYEVLRRAATKCLKSHQCNSEKYRQILVNDTANRYYRGEKGERLNYLPRKNFQAALAYLENLDWEYFGPLVMPNASRPFYKNTKLY